MLTGAAPIAPNVVDFLRAAFSAPVYEGYGQTETAAAISVSDTHDRSSGSTTAPLPCCEVKLIDVAAMRYTSADLPFPRGEICVRGENVFKGYYKMADKTAETLDEDGYSLFTFI
jgi:long-chain acyl-CoA synthetase